MLVKPMPARGARLYKVVITCPNTGRDVPTGFAMTEPVFAVATLYNVKLRCPQCGLSHYWSVRDARLVESPATAGASVNWRPRATSSQVRSSRRRAFRFCSRR